MTLALRRQRCPIWGCLINLAVRWGFICTERAFGIAIPDVPWGLGGVLVPPECPCCSESLWGLRNVAFDDVDRNALRLLGIQAKRKTDTGVHGARLTTLGCDIISDMSLWDERARAPDSARAISVRMWNAIAIRRCTDGLCPNGLDCPAGRTYRGEYDPRPLWQPCPDDCGACDRNLHMRPSYAYGAR